MTGADTHFEGLARLNNADPALSQDASMHESVARTVREFNEAKSLLGAEPFDNATDGWPGRGHEPGLGESGSGAEKTRLWVEGINGEVTTPRITEVLMSQVVS